MFIFMSKVTIETREGRESRKGTTENETLQTAKRSRRVNKTGGQGKQAAEQLRSEKGHENQWAEKPNQVLFVKREFM